ncbi:protein disulfide-isomerase A3-like isoform X3 [Limulus polyphemus]|uniref:Protein disulfide-isomerase n=1 Tax=Limulus polyphemus TaxID=6850 RepID=A0ABM1SKM9_LIMPO|nr:protein disulfide-isomerase A3-like isoform X3 [Limulus polyphemus]
MKLLLLLVCLAAFASASDVLDYSGPDFEDLVKEHDIILVEFFAPWCGHCKKLAPEYESAATTLKNNDPPVSLAKVDCTSDNGKETCSKYGVSGYPTLKIFRQGEFSAEYSGPRQADGIIKYMKTQVGPSSKEVSTVAEAEKLLTKDEVVIFGFFKDDDKLKQTFQKVADKQREDYTFGHSSTEEVLNKYGYKDQIVLFRPKKFQSKFEEKALKYDGPSESYKLEKFIRDNYHGLAGHRTQGNMQQFKSPLVVAYFKVDYVKNIKGTNYWRNRIMKVAEKFKDKLNFAVSAKDDKPAFGAKNEQGQKFRMEDEYSPENLEKFLQDLVDGKLKPHIKSEPIPESNDAPVKVAVGQSFNEIVMNNDKDVLVEFYAPWCGHCKNLAPIYDDLGKKMENEDEVEIVKMDATANDVPPNFEVHGFPTLYWVPKGKKDKPIKYEGGRELDDFIKYIAKHATNELKGWNRKGKKKKSEL